MEALIAHMTPVDLLLVEGFKSYPHAKLEVFRAALGKPLTAADDPSIVAVATDSDPGGLAVPVLDLNDPPRIADFIVGHCRLAGGHVHGAA
jgi:molybdopterin-guanine dinucleotide biosynthesis protein B